MAYLDDNGLLYLWNKIKTLVTNAISNKVDKVPGKGLSTNDYTTAEKDKLAGVASGAEVNQNAFSHVLVGGTTLSADQKLDVLTLGAGSNITLTPDAATDKVTISSTNTTYNPATGSAAGLMSAADKTKLDGVASSANNYVHPDTHPASMIIQSDYYKFVSTQQINLWNSSASPATPSQNGQMAKEDKAKLDAFGPASTYALKADIVGMYKYKGSVADASKLPTTGQVTGDVYNIAAPSIYGAAGANVAWDGSKWDSLGEIFTITSITNAQIDTICA
ncbi:hypothetical protein [Robinsoniella peoriensis]